MWEKKGLLMIQGSDTFLAIRSLELVSGDITPAKTVSEGHLPEGEEV
jgi:hypothetical protein